MARQARVWRAHANKAVFWENNCTSMCMLCIFVYCVCAYICIYVCTCIYIHTRMHTYIHEYVHHRPEAFSRQNHGLVYQPYLHDTSVTPFKDSAEQNNSTAHQQLGSHINSTTNTGPIGHIRKQKKPCSLVLVNNMKVRGDMSHGIKWHECMKFHVCSR